MSKENSLKEDRVVEYLERGQHWVSEKYKPLLIAIVGFLAVALIMEHRENSALERENQLWNQSAELSSIDEKKQFIVSYSKSSAAKALAIVLAREFLDAGQFLEAKKVCDNFIQNGEGHKLIHMAYLLRAYANEELGHAEEAKKDYEFVSRSRNSVSLIATKSLGKE